MTIYSLDVLLLLFGTSLLFHEQNLVHQDTGERNSDPTGDLPVGVRESWQRRGSVVACCRVGGMDWGNTCLGSFEGGYHYLHYLHHSLVNSREGKQLHSQQKIGLKIY